MKILQQGRLSTRLLVMVSALALTAAACSSGDSQDDEILAQLDETQASIDDLSASISQLAASVSEAAMMDDSMSDDAMTDDSMSDDDMMMEDITVGYISLGDSVPFVKLVSDGIREEADRLGVNLLFCDSEIDAAKALACAQNFEVQGAQGVLNFQVFEESSPEICAAHGDVPVIAIDIVQPPCQVSFMGANNRLAGQLGGRALGQYMSDQFGCDYTAYVSLESTAAGSANRDRMGGYREGFQEFCPIENERVLDGADRTDPALEQMTNLLTAVPGDRIVVVAINEDGILGAIGAANTLGRQDDLYYSGQGTDPSIWCEIVNNDNYIASVAYFPERYGTILIPAIINAVQGNAIAGQLFTDHQIINRDNIGEVYPDSADC